MQNHEWIVSILDDVACYAEKNNLTKLKETLKTAQAVAVVETGYEVHDPSRLRRPKLELVK